MNSCNQLNSLALAYLGDAVYELYIRNYLVTKNLVKVNELQKESLKFVAAKSQATILEKLIEKYSLFNINIKLEDNTINELKKNLEYLNTLSYFEEANLDLEKIKLITEIDKLLI